MVQAFIALIAMIVLVVMSRRANRRFAQESRLPMQWSLAGSVNWTAPRALALAFMPLLGAIILTATTVATITMTPRPGQEGLEASVIIVMSIGLVAMHALHIRLIRRTLRSSGG